MTDPSKYLTHFSAMSSARTVVRTQRWIFSAQITVLALSALMLQSVSAQAPNWAFEENFDNADPSSPSQALLPRTFDYAVTHRIHPKDILNSFPTYRADHGLDCAGPKQPNPAMHEVQTSHFSSGDNPDQSFFICKKHMMSSMGDVSGYSVTSFWPRQEFDFGNGGVLEFDVNINENPGRFWWEILIAPRDQLKPGAAEDHWPIDEVYPEDRIRFGWSSSGERRIGVGAGLNPPQGWIVNDVSWRTPRFINPSDPAITDRTIRRRMRLTLENSVIHWDFETADGSFHRHSVDVPGGLPFSRGLVLFKTHAYTPNKDDNFDFTTWHWDNIRFSGPVLAPYRAVESRGVAYLQANGDRPIGDRADLTINLDSVGSNPKLFGQIHSPLRGQVKLSINGNAQIDVDPLHYLDDDCASSGWSSFIFDVPPAQLRRGENTFTWIVGPRPSCAGYNWNGFSVKDMELQFDAAPNPDPISQLSINDIVVNESDGRGTFTISRSRTSNPSPVSVWVAATRTGTATPGSDYYGFSKKLEFQVGEFTKSADVVVVDDDDSGEGRETIRVRLVKPENATVTRRFGEMTIIDND